MKKTYHVSGMTCNGCRSSVESDLRSIPEVENAEVDLEKERVVVHSKEPIETQKLQAALSDKYTIKESENSQPKQQADTPASSEKSKWQQLKPLFLIFAYITAASLLMHLDNFELSPIMYDFMGLFFIVFGIFKLLDLKGFQVSFSMYDPLARALPVYGFLYPFIETLLGLMFLFRLELHIALIATLVVLGITTYGVTRTLLDKKSIKCACLGTALDLPMTEATFIENAVMIVMAVVMLVS